MPQIVFDIINIIASVIRLLGMAALGAAIGYLAVDMFHKAQTWPMQVALFLGLAGLVIAMVVFLAPGALGAFGLGFGAAIFIWAMPKKQKEVQE
jgi:NhaP-type Na+/H+ or K+/H+ antiporter